jgi:hypothetical protein
MSTATIPRLSLLALDFAGLYTRHLGRHSQAGINVAHLIALYGIWFGIYASLDQGARLMHLPASWLVVVIMAAGYLATISINSPPAVIAVTTAFMALFVTSVLSLPDLPAWSIVAFLALIPICYKLQSYSHRIWTKAADMSDFNKRFPPGRDLNIVLLFYEVPICLNYLVFRPMDWTR